MPALIVARDTGIPNSAIDRCQDTANPRDTLISLLEQNGNAKPSTGRRHSTRLSAAAGEACANARPPWSPSTKPRRLDDDPSWLREAGYLDERVPAEVVLSTADFLGTAGSAGTAERRQ